MEWQVTYNGSAPVGGFEVDARGPMPDLKQVCVEACHEIRKGRHEHDQLSLSVNADSLRGVPMEAGGSAFYQPVGRIICIHHFVEGTIKKVSLFAIIVVDEGSQLGHSDAKYRCHVFKCKSEQEGNELQYGCGRMMVQLSNATKRRPLRTLQNATHDELQAAVKWWNANNPLLFHYELSPTGDIISGNVKFNCQIDPSVKAMQKVVRLTNQAKSENLVRLLAEKFNIPESDMDLYAVFHHSHDTGEQNMLQADESPVSMSVCFEDPNSGSFWLRKIPAGLVRAAPTKVSLGAEIGESSTDGVAAEEEGSPLGPTLPYHKDDEDLLLNVMIARQTGNGLGFKLTPAYLLQMLIAYAAVHEGDDALRRLLGKIAAAIRQVVSAHPSSTNMLLFWASNSIKLVSSIAKEPHVFAVYSESTKHQLDTTIDLALSNLRACVQTGSVLPGVSTDWKTLPELRAVITDYVRAMDQNMSYDSLREVVARITEAMPPKAAVAPPQEADAASSKSSNDSPMTSTPLPNRTAEEVAENGSSAGSNPADTTVPGLPEEWEELIDPETNHRFFANHRTQQTSWTDPRDQLVTVQLMKGDRGLGVGISGAKKTWNDQLIHGIFVSSLMPGSPAAEDGTLHEGDEILEVDGHSLIGVTREGAIEFLKQVKMGESVTLLVAQEPQYQQRSDRSLRHTAL